METQNCFSLVGSEFQRGIALKPKGGPTVQEIRCVEGFINAVGVQPDASGACVPNGHLILSAPAENGGTLACLNCRCLPYAGHIIFFDVKKLAFGDKYFNKLNLWPGGEWHGLKPLYRENRTKEGRAINRGFNCEKAELWALKHGEKCLVVDVRTSLRFLISEPSGPRLYRPEPIEIGQYLLIRGQKARSPKALAWALRTLQRLNDLVDNQELRKFLRELEQRELEQIVL